MQAFHLPGDKHLEHLSFDGAVLAGEFFGEGVPGELLGERTGALSSPAGAQVF
jgi:hypothetical protein